MDDPKYRRLVRLLVWSWVSIVVLVFTVFALGSWQLSQVRAIASEIQSEPIPGPAGTNGIDGTTETITSYLPSKDGKNATDEQVQQAVDDYFASHPVQNGKDGKDGESIQGPEGLVGPAGPPGLVTFVRQTILGDWECKLGSDSGWSPLGECQ